MERFTQLFVISAYFFLVILLNKVESNSTVVQLCSDNTQLIVSAASINGSFAPLPQNFSYSIEKGNKEEAYFEVKCLSKSPVRIQFSGLLVNPVKSAVSQRISTYSEETKSECYEIRVVLQSKKEATGKYSCSGYENISMETSAYIYAHDAQQPHLLYASLRSKLIETISGTKAIIPCLTSNGKSDIKLYKGDEDLTQNSLVDYDPTIGFTFDISSFENPFTNDYVCVESWPENLPMRTFNVSVSLLPPSDKTLSKNVTFQTVEINDNYTAYKCYGATFMTYVRCDSPLECAFVNSCSKKPIRSYCEVGRECDPYEQDCYSVVLKDFNGLIFCSNDANSLSRSVYLDLAGKSFISNSTDIDVGSLENALLIDFIPTIYKTWENVVEFKFQEDDKFTCNVSKLVGSEGIKWEFELTDGQRIPATILSETTMNEKTHYSKTSVIYFNNMKTAKLVCLAPKINSDKWLRISSNITMEASAEPVLDGKPQETVTVSLIKNPNPTLSCGAWGELIQFAWYKNGRPVSDRHHQILNVTAPHYLTSSIRIFYEGESTFNEEQNSFVQEYSCVAENFRGKATKNITVKWEIESSGLSWFAIIIILAIFSMLFITIITGLIYYYRKNKSQFSQEDIEKFLKGDPSIYKNNNYSNNVEDDDDDVDVDQSYVYVGLPYLNDKEILNPDKNLIIEEKIGHGNFGDVYKAVLKYNGEVKNVAIKTIKSGAKEQEFRNLLAELKLMQYVGEHNNIVKFIGSVTKDIRKMKAQIVVEYCSYCDLKKYLKNMKNSFQDELVHIGGYDAMPQTQISNGYSQIGTPIRTSDLFRWSYEIADGMQYLVEKRLIHRDLAARNVLLDDHLTCKITDFGLSKNLFNTDDQYYTTTENGEKRFPLRWLALESLQSLKFSTNTDIWSFGVTIWEIFALGDDPYPTLPESQTMLLQRILESGFRMSPPRYANQAVTNIMNMCWNTVGSQRPRFSELRDLITAAKATVGQPEPQQNQPVEQQEQEQSLYNNYSPLELQNYMSVQALYGYDGKEFYDQGQECYEQAQYIEE